MKSQIPSTYIFFVFILCCIHISLTGQIQIDWRTLENVSYKMSYDSTAGYVVMEPVYGETLKALEGQLIEIRGYIIPIDTEGSEYVLSAFPFSACFFCGGGGKETVMELKFSEKSSYSIDQTLTFSGILRFGTDPFGLNYILENATEVVSN